MNCCGVSDMRLIDADALEKSAGLFEAKVLARGCGKSILHLAKAWLFNEVEKAPTIDAVPVIRCSECIHYETCEGGKDFCCFHAIGIVPDDFCSYGERKDGEQCP